MELREQLIRVLNEKGIYHARRMSVIDVVLLLSEIIRVDELINENKTIGDK